MMAAHPIDKIAAAVETGRLRASLMEMLDEEPFSRIEEWAESLTAIAEAIMVARDAVEQWTDAEGREEKADAKDEALEALDGLVGTWNESPLDVSALRDWEAPE